jgi:hypothetical protein
MKKKLEQIDLPFPSLLGEFFIESTYYQDLEEKIKEVWKLEMEKCRDFDYWRKKYWKDGK